MLRTTYTNTHDDDLTDLKIPCKTQYKKTIDWLKKSLTRLNNMEIA